MIYLVFYNSTDQKLEFPKVICTDKPFEHIRISWTYGSSYIFEFREGMPVYYKIRSGEIFTEEELVVLKLKAKQESPYTE